VSRLRALNAAPATIPSLAAFAIFVWWAADQGGQPVTVWGPGALIVLGLLVVAVVVVPVSWGNVPRAVRVAIAGITGYSLWSYASILWSSDPGAALLGANRTLLYAFVFVLLALWPQRRSTAALILGAWTLAIIVLAAVATVRMGTGAPRALFLDDRLQYPAGYPNAAAAVFLMALWPAITLGAARDVPWWLRGLFAGGAVALADLGLLTLSRGALFTVPVVIVVLFALVPGRLRNGAVFVVVGVAVAAAVPTLLHVSDVLDNPHAAASGAVDAAARAIVLGAVLAGAVVTAMARLEPRLAPGTRERVRRGGIVVAALAVVVVAIGGLVAIGNPAHRLSNAWHSFTQGYTQNSGANRLASGLGSNRYDFYRVAVKVFKDDPIGGAGADNYFQQYLRLGHSSETPHYPHSVELRTLEETGIVGALILLTTLGAALLAAGRAMYRTDDRLTVAVAGGATVAFVYWLAHGSFDWFWEFAGLGAPAFALLGLACSLHPPPPGAPDGAAAAAGRPAFGWPRIALVVAAAVGAIAIAGVWLSARDVDRAAKIYATRPLKAYSILDQAGSLDPLSDEPALIAGGIALRYNDLPRADRQFADALGRVPDGAYATLERGAIASAQGDRARALTLLQRAVTLNPRDALTRQALAVVRSGGTIDVGNLNRQILAQAQELASG
jgi:tetratricopeptide (TPR) repeat protein